MDTRSQTVARTPVGGPRAELVAAGGGLLAVVALAAALAVLPADEGGSSAADVAARYADGSTGYLRAAFLEGLASTGLLVFAAGLCAVLHRACGAVALVAVAALGAGVAVALHLVGYAVIATLASGAAARGNPDVVLAAWDLSSAAFGFGSFGLAAFFAATAVVLLRSRVLGRGAGWTAAGMAVLSLAAAGSLARDGLFSLHGTLGFLALVLLYVWVLGASIALLRRRGR